MPGTPKKWLWRAAAFLGAVFLAACLYGGWHVYHYGFTHKWRTLLSAELRRRGLDFTATGLTLSPFEGLVAENANLYLLDEHHTHLMSMDRAAVDINFFKLLQKKPFLNSLDLRGTRLWVPVDLGDSPPKLRLRRLQAKLLFLPGEVQIAQAEGEVQGMQISVSGSLLHPENFAQSTSAPVSAEERERRRAIARRVIDEIRKIRSDGTPPRVEARFSGDLAHLDQLRAEVQVRGDNVRRGKYLLGNVAARINYERGILRIQSIQMADARGRLSASGEANLAAGEAHLQLDSTLDLPALAREVLPETETTLAPFVFHDTPHLRIDDGRVSFRSPENVGADVSPRAPAYQLTGHLSLGRCGYRGLEFERAETEFTVKNDRWYLRGSHLARQGNAAQAITADLLAEPGSCRVRLTSTFDPAFLTPILPARGRSVLADWKFLDAPRLELSASGRSFGELETFRAEGQLALGRTRYRGVPLNRFHTGFAYDGREMALHHPALERDEGSGAGDTVVYDLERHEVRLENVRATLDPEAVGVWLDPDVAHALAPYHFHKPPSTVTNGVVQFEGGRNSRLTVDFTSPGVMEYLFVRRPLVFRNLAGQVVFNEDRLRLNGLSGEIFNGKVRGSLDLSLIKGAPDYSAAIEAQGLDFAALTKLFFDYDTSKGQLDGSYRFTGRGDDPRTLHGSGQLRVSGGNIFAIPFLGPLSGILGQILPNFGMDVAHEASSNFLTSGGKIYTGNIDVKGAAFSLFAAGWLGYANDTMSMRARVNTRGLPGKVLEPVSKFFEYTTQGPLAKPVWKPRLFASETAESAPAAVPIAEPAAKTAPLAPPASPKHP